MNVMRQAVVDQHGLAGRAKHDAGRLDVVMDHVLAVQIGQRGGDPDAEHPRLVIGKRQRRQPAIERFAGNALDHDIGLAVEVAGAETGRHVRPLEARQDHHLHLEADDGGGILALRDARDFHQERR